MSWIREYLIYRTGTESPASFNLFSGLTSLGAAMGRKVWLETGDLDSRVYPSLYTVLVAPPGMARKSASIAAMRAMLDHAETPLLPYAVGRDALVRFARDHVRKISDYHHSSMALFSSEFSAMFDEARGRQATIALLNEWFDCPARYSSVSRKLDGTIIYGVFLSILASSTPTALGRMFTRDDLQSGLASRMLFVVEGEASPRRAWEGKEPEHKTQIYDRLRAYLYRVEHGPVNAMTMTKEARSAYREWYEGDDYSASIALPVMQSYLARRQAHVLKLAMIIEYSSAYVANGWPPRKIGVESFRSALALVRSLEPRMPLALRDRKFWAPDFSRQALLAHVTAHKTGVTLNDLQRAYNAAAQSWEVDKAVEDLVMLGYLSEGKDGRLCATGKAGKK